MLSSLRQFQCCGVSGQMRSRGGRKPLRYFLQRYPSIRYRGFSWLHFFGNVGSGSVYVGYAGGAVLYWGAGLFQVGVVEVYFGGSFFLDSSRAWVLVDEQFDRSRLAQGRLQLLDYLPPGQEVGSQGP